MFRLAYKIAREFTFPVILSRRTIADAFSSFIGAYVVINAGCWI